MKVVKQKVKDICEEVYKFGFSQIIIDLVQDDIEDLLEDDDILRDDIGATTYVISLLLEVYNPALEKDVDFLQRLEKALRDWQSEYEEINRLLGLPPEN